MHTALLHGDALTTTCSHSDQIVCRRRPSRQNTLFPVTRPGILAVGQSVGAQVEDTPVRARVGRPAN